MRGVGNLGLKEIWESKKNIESLRVDGIEKRPCFGCHKLFVLINHLLWLGGNYFKLQDLESKVISVIAFCILIFELKK